MPWQYYKRTLFKQPYKCHLFLLLFCSHLYPKQESRSVDINCNNLPFYFDSIQIFKFMYPIYILVTWFVLQQSCFIILPLVSRFLISFLLTKVEFLLYLCARPKIKNAHQRYYNRRCMNHMYWLYPGFLYSSCTVYFEAYVIYF